MTEDQLIAALIERIGRLRDIAEPRRSPSDLSPTEQKVFALLGEQLSEREIAAKLERSPHTVHVHIKSIYRKLSVGSRAELRARTQQQPLIKNTRPIPRGDRTGFRGQGYCHL